MTGHIWLIGHSGVGKSTIAPLLADFLGIFKCDIDYEIQTWRGLQCRTIIEQEGETMFRNYETQMIHKVAHSNFGAVIATGAGACERWENRAAMRGSGVVIYMFTADYDGAVRRERQRHIEYTHLADATVYVDGKHPTRIVQKIYECL